MRNLRKNKGITLIALVITIIVMLILVAVTITVAVNGGLFDYARKAAVDTNTKIEEEQEYANITEDDWTYENLIDKYAAKEIITFSIGGTQYRAEKNMTFRQWVANGLYNTGGFYADDNLVKNSGGKDVMTKTSRGAFIPLFSDMRIVEGSMYYLN